MPKKGELIKREFTLWYYSATALDNFGGTEEVEVYVRDGCVLASQSDIFEPVIIGNSPTNWPVKGGDDWYRCDVIEGWGVESPKDNSVVFTYYRP